jgi:hypothetical protein
VSAAQRACGMYAQVHRVAPGAEAPLQRDLPAEIVLSGAATGRTA